MPLFIFRINDQGMKKKMFFTAFSICISNGFQNLRLQASIHHTNEQFFLQKNKRLEMLFLMTLKDIIYPVSEK